MFHIQEGIFMKSRRSSRSKAAAWPFQEWRLHTAPSAALWPPATFHFEGQMPGPAAGLQLSALWH